MDLDKMQQEGHRWKESYPLLRFSSASSLPVALDQPSQHLVWQQTCVCVWLFEAGLCFDVSQPASALLLLPVTTLTDGK